VDAWTEINKQGHRSRMIHSLDRKMREISTTQAHKKGSQKQQEDEQNYRIKAGLCE